MKGEQTNGMRYPNPGFLLLLLFFLFRFTFQEFIAQDVLQPEGGIETGGRFRRSLGVLAM